MEEQSEEKRNEALEDTTQATQLLEKILHKQEKQLFYARLTALAGCGFLIAVLVALVMILPRAVRILDEANEVVLMAEETLANANETLTDISDMSTNVTTVCTEMGTFLSDNSETLSGAMEDISAIDFEGLNRAIQDLEDVVEPLANMMNAFR